MIEYKPWYRPGQSLIRCQRCGALLADSDSEIHTGWHDKIEQPLGWQKKGTR